jgi:hypothetical protein
VTKATAVFAPAGAPTKTTGRAMQQSHPAFPFHSAPFLFMMQNALTKSLF